MGYQYMFYGLDLERLKEIYGSNDSDFVAEVLQSAAAQYGTRGPVDPLSTDARRRIRCSPSSTRP